MTNTSQELTMQTELITDLPSNRHGVGATPTKTPAADAAPSGISREFRNFVADMEELIKASTPLTGDDLARAKANLSARVAVARAFVEEMPAGFSDRARNTVKATDGYVREQPWQSIGLTAAAGLLIGFLLGRRGQ
jgi:ElaB/YqjD/DUF883 family membrane-anchored ribosome-binding protein